MDPVEFSLPRPPSSAVAEGLPEDEGFSKGREIEPRKTETADLPVFEAIKSSSSRKSKSRILKHKSCQDGKTTDKKILKASGKNKHDPFVNVPGLLRCESISGGSNRLGIYGLKSDSCDVSRHINELSLDELLDGSYKYSNICKDNGKKSHIGESTLLSVRKACTVLSGMKGSTDGEVSMSIPSFNLYGQKLLHSDNMDKHILEEAASSGKGLDSFMKDTCNTSILQPKDLLDHLTLPPTPDLDAVILESNVTSLSMKSMKLKTKMSGASLPPFPWSFCHSGSSKTSIDLGKSASTRHMCQSRWLKIESNFAIGYDKSCFTELDLEECFCNKDSSDLLKIEDMPKRQLLDKIAPVKNTSIVNSHGLRESMLCEKNKMNVTEHKFDYDEHAANASTCAEVGSRSLRDKSHLDELYGTNGKGRPMLGTCGSSRTFYHDSFNAASGSHKKYSIFPKMSKEELSPRGLAGAEILFQMAGPCGARRARDDDRVKFRRPRSPQLKVTEACRPISASCKADRLLPSLRHQDQVKIMDPTVRCKSTGEKSSTRTHSSDGLGHVRWSGLEARCSPSKSEKDSLLSIQSFDGLSARQISTASPLRAEKGFGLQHHRIRKHSIDASVNFGVTSQIKDWSRGRVKRM